MEVISLELRNSCMFYCFERYYENKLSLEKIVLVTAKTIGQWCDYYKVNVFWPKDRVKDSKQEGELPQDNHQKEAFTVCVPAKKGIWKLLGFQQCFSPRNS